MKLKQRKKMLMRKIILMISTCLLLIWGISSTIAFFTDNTNDVVNAFTSGKVTTKITEDFNGEVKNNVAIKNTGNITAYIRAAVVVTWKDKDGNVSREVPVEDIHYTIDWYNEDSSQENDAWTKASDGFYYYKLPITPEKSTPVLFTNCKLNLIEGASAPKGYYLNVEIIGSGIQSVPTSVVTKEWSSGVSGINEDGTTLDIKTLSIDTNN